MNNLEDSESNAKISDSAYSNSCSNSQSRRSSKSTHSGSHSSGSSGYGGGKPPTSGYSPKSSGLTHPPEKRVKTCNTELTLAGPEDTQTGITQIATTFKIPEEDIADASLTSDAGVIAVPDPESVDISNSDKASIKDEVMGTYNITCTTPTPNPLTYLRCTTNNNCADGFSCVISMHDGVVMYTTTTLTTSLGFPKDMWIGRSFIDFIHPKDRETFAAQITNGLAAPKSTNNTQNKVNSNNNPVSTMVSRIRIYRGMSTGYGVKDLMVAFMPFLLKLTFKNVNDEEGNIMYLVIQATPFFSAFKIPNEPVIKASPFIIRHSANGNLDYIDTESIPYLGYLPQDMIDKDALLLYHYEDLPYLRQVYKTIVTEGGMARCKSYRMQAQNGDYIRVETEWLSFINPWSRKLEFIIGKHFVIEGPTNQYVFDTPDPKKAIVLPVEVQKEIQSLRENILRIMNEELQVLTKPAEVAKQQMTKRCQELASFMESLMEDVPKIDEELRLEIQDPDHSYYERDSVMLGGISPHHEYNDSKSSAATPLSYNEINYNETLQRYFESHGPTDKEAHKPQPEETPPANADSPGTSNWFSKTTPQSADSRSSEVVSSSNESTFLTLSTASLKIQLGEYKPLRLTESLMNRHNTEMEKELFKKHREFRSNSKMDREKNNENYQKKKEHLARCNASFQPTTAELQIDPEPPILTPNVLKRPLKNTVNEATSSKHRCTSLQQPSRRSTVVAATPAHNSNAAWSNAGNGINAYILGVGVPQPMPIVNPVTSIPGMFPMYYSTAQPPSVLAAVPNDDNMNPKNAKQTPVQCMLYGQAMYGQPIMYSPMNHAMPYNMQPTLSSNTRYENMNALGLASSNYEEACKISLPEKSNKSSGSFWRGKKWQQTRNDSTKTDQVCNNSSSSKSTFLRSAETVTEPSARNDRTDGESSYSSFYSSFFKTESGSADDSDAKKPKKANLDVTGGYFEKETEKKVNKRKMEPPWLENVCFTPNLIYKYQIKAKTMEEVLKADKLKIKTMEQPTLVNEQLGQLYMDLQLEGVAARLTLEEGITSSSSSGEESTVKPKETKTKREYSKLVMIYEEDAPLPSPPSEPEEPTPSTSTAVI